MKFHSNKKSLQTGMTLIEVLLYIALLSFLLSGILNFVYENGYASQELWQKLIQSYD